MDFFGVGNGIEKLAKRLTGYSSSDRFTNTPYYHTPHQIIQGSPEWIDVSQRKLFEVYQTTAELYAVIKRRGSMLSSGEWKHYQITKSGEVVEIENSPYVTLLENPNPMMSGNSFLELWDENMCVFGNNFMLDARPAGGIMPYVLNHLPVEDVEMDFTGNIWMAETMEEIIRSYKLVSNNQSFETNEILHTKILNGRNPLKGESPFVPLRQDISNIRASKQFQNVILVKHGALGILSPKTSGENSVPLTVDERIRVEKQWQKTYGIGTNQNQVMIAQTALDWSSTSFASKDLMLFETISSGFKKIIDTYGLNENIFSREKASTFNNVAEGFKQAYISTIIPNADEKAMALSMKFGLVEKNQFLAIDYSKIPFLQNTPKEKAEELNLKANAVQNLQKSTVYTSQEIKDIANF